MTMLPKTQIKHALSRSTWVTGGWNWLLTLVSRAAEAILTVTILYATLQIFIETNPQVDLGMFLAQQVALDAGGIGLIKMSNQAKKDGHEESARKARTVALILMVLMGLGVVISDVESKLTLTTTTLVAHQMVTTTLDFRHAYPAIAIVIEILLLVARGAMAIVYGFTIHDLESAMPEPSAPIPAEPGVEEVVRQAMERFVAEQEQRFQTMADTQHQALEQLTGEQQRIMALIGEMAHTHQRLRLDLSAISREELVQAVIERLYALCADPLEATPTRQLAPAPYSISEETVLTHPPQSHSSPQRTDTQASIPKRTRRIDPHEVDAVVWPLLECDHDLTHRKIAALPQVGYTETVVYASVKRWRARHPAVNSLPSPAAPQTPNGAS